jgi:hypothetical protein
MARLMRASIVSIFALILSANILAGPGDNWPQFRGAQGGVAADDPALPTRWNSTKNIVWKIDVRALRPVYAVRPGASGDISLKPGETSNASIV